MIESAYGIKVDTIEDALNVPRAVRDAWHEYVYQLCIHYEIKNGRWIRLETL